MKIKSMMDLYVDQLLDIYSAEKQLLKALPKMAKAASHDNLRQAFENHLRETEGHVERVERILAGLDKKPGRKVCEAMKGLVEEGAEMIEIEADDDVRDAGLVVAAQKVEHYEIASYGCLRTHAQLLGRGGDAKLLDKTLEEEKKADVTLTELATSVVNAEAATA
jgi:ferritin-like metal-binding protein YciE